MATLSFMWLRHKGASIIFILFLIRVPVRFLDEKYYTTNSIYLRGVEEIQRAVLHKKLLKTSSATNKTISESKYSNCVFD
jgi:hypothetical protein